MWIKVIGVVGIILFTVCTFMSGYTLGRKRCTEVKNLVWKFPDEHNAPAAGQVLSTYTLLEVQGGAKPVIETKEQKGFTISPPFVQADQCFAINAEFSEENGGHLSDFWRSCKYYIPVRISTTKIFDPAHTVYRGLTNSDPASTVAIMQTGYIIEIEGKEYVAWPR